MPIIVLNITPFVLCFVLARQANTLCGKLDKIVNLSFVRVELKRCEKFV